MGRATSSSVSNVMSSSPTAQRVEKVRGVCGGEVREGGGEVREGGGEVREGGGEVRGVCVVVR